MLSGFCPAPFGVLFCNLVLGCRTHLNLLDRVVSGARFLTEGVFQCYIAHRRSVAILCMLYKIRCNPVHPLNGALPRPHVPVRVTHGTMVAHLFTYMRLLAVEYLWATSLQNLGVPKDFYSPLSVPLVRSC